MGLDDVLDDNPPAREPAEPAVVEKPPVEAKQAEEPKKQERERGEDGKFIEKRAAVEKPVEPGGSQNEPVKQEMTAKERAAFAAAADERRKRQALEQEIAELKKAKEDPPKPFWDDPEGAFKKAEDSQSKIINEVKQMLAGHSLKTAEYIARQKYTDFDEKIAEFSVIVHETPGLAQEWLASPDPAEYAYKVAKNRMELREVGSIDAFKQKVEKEMRAKLEAEFKAKAEADAKLRREIPGSLSEVPGTQGQSAQVWGGPTPLTSILSGR